MVDHGLYMVISWSTMFLKHGRPCLKHGQPCFDRVHFTGVFNVVFFIEGKSLWQLVLSYRVWFGICVSDCEQT